MSSLLPYLRLSPFSTPCYHPSHTVSVLWSFNDWLTVKRCMLCSFTALEERPSTLAYRPLVSSSPVSLPFSLTWALTLGSYLSLIKRSVRFFHIPRPSSSFITVYVSSFVGPTCRTLILTLWTPGSPESSGKTKRSHWTLSH